MVDSIFPEDELEAKMYEWGILKEDIPSIDEPMVLAPYKWFKKLEKKADYGDKLSKLEKRIQELESILKIQEKPRKVDVIYEKYKEELEKENVGKFVAIDLSEEKIISVGETIIEAYKKAKEETGKNKFAYKKIGYSSEYLMV